MWTRVCAQKQPYLREVMHSGNDQKTIILFKVKVLGKLLQMLLILFILQNGVSALIIASQEGHYEVADLLIEQGANVNLQDEVG